MYPKKLIYVRLLYSTVLYDRLLDIQPRTSIVLDLWIFQYCTGSPGQYKIYWRIQYGRNQYTGRCEALQTTISNSSVFLISTFSSLSPRFPTCSIVFYSSVAFRIPNFMSFDPKLGSLFRFQAFVLSPYLRDLL
jgi:hypothetical protein